MTVLGLRFSGPVRTALDLSRAARNLTEAVVALDLMLQAKVITADDLTARMSDSRAGLASVKPLEQCSCVAKGC